MHSAKTRLLIYNSKLPNNNFHLTRAVEKAFNLLPDTEAVIAHPDTLGFFLRTFRPSAVLAFGGEAITPETLGELAPSKERSAVPWVLWTTEDPFELEVTVPIAAFFDMVLTSDKGSLTSYAAHANSHYMPLAADPDVHFYPVQTRTELLVQDLIFVGTAWPNRVAFLTELGEQTRRYGFRTRFLVPTNPSIPKKDLDKIGQPFEREVRLAPKDLAAMQNQCVFSLTLLREFSRHSPRKPRPQTSPTNRFFETSLAGTGHLFVSDTMDILSFYPEVKEHVLQPHGVKEIVQALLEARKNPEWRNRSAQTLQDFAMESHLYLHRARAILELLRL